MFPTFISILDIQSWWEVPSIAHFCSLFRTAFNLLDFDIEDLEEALLTDGTEETSWLQELIVRLLSGCLPHNEISTFNYQMFLRRLFRQKCQEHDQYNPFNTDIDFQLLPLRTKVDILHALCDFRLDADDVLDQLKNLEADSLRVEPLGYDSNDSAYWYFYGTRLYREDFKTKNQKKKSVWQVICFTEDDWFQLNKKFKKSTSKCERQLHRTLTENFLPELPRLFREKERLARKRLLENQPRRTSQRLRKETPTADLVEKSQPLPEAENKISVEEEEKSKRQALEKQRREAYERRNRLKDQSEDSQSERSESRYEMGGNKVRQKKSNTKTRQRKLSDSSTNSKDAINKGSKRKKTSDGGKSSTSSSATTTVGRQTNNSLAAATGQIVIQSVANPHKKKLKTSQVFRQTDEDLITGMHKILDCVKNHEDAWPFVDPVDEDYAPNYYSVIRKPMDLQRMEDRLDSGYYKNFSKFRDDFQLIVDNCRLYNGAENEYTEMVDSLLKVFERATEKFLDQISSSDDEIAVEYPDSEDTKDAVKRKQTIEPKKRKPTLVAKTDKKRERSLTDDDDDNDDEMITKSSSLQKRESLSMDSLADEAIDNSVVRSKTKIKQQKMGKKIEQNAKKDKIEAKKRSSSSSKDKKNLRTNSKNNKKEKSKVVRSRSSSPLFKRDYSSSPPPSSAPSSPDNRFDFLPKKQKTHHNEKSAETAAKGKVKQKQDRFKGLFDADDSPTKKQQPPAAEKSPASMLPAKPKDKHNKLRETIEKLKAKSISNKFSNDDEYRFDLDTPKENKEKNHHHHHHRKDKEEKSSKSKKEKLNKAQKRELEHHNNHADSNSTHHDNKKTKKMNARNYGVKNAEIEALTIATAETLKDINKWLDDTPKSPDFSSVSNSPSYGALEYDFDKQEASTAAQNTSSTAPPTDPKKKNDGKTIKKDLLGKDVKRRNINRDPGKFLKRREIQRTIDRLQPGKSKGNLISTVQNSNKQSDELFPLGPLSKQKDMKNSLIVKTDDNAPKLSLGTVLDNFGKHKFVDDAKNQKDEENGVKSDEKFSFSTAATTTAAALKESVKTEAEKKEVDEKVAKKEVATPIEETSMMSTATPNLSAWFKAFGAPKTTPSTTTTSSTTTTTSSVLKKIESKSADSKETDTKSEVKDETKVAVPEVSPSELASPHGAPIPRQRRISTGSSVSERSSFSQDMDSPRVGIDERLGAYPAPYPSPLHRSPSGASPASHTASPRADMSPKAPYPPFNGQIRVGFYQDTVSNKSSPDKSCSPRDNPQSPYNMQSSEHVYPPNTTQNIAYSYPNSPYYTHTPNYSNPAPYNADYYDTSKSLTEQYQANKNYSANSPMSASPQANLMQQQPSPNLVDYNNRQQEEQKQQNSIFPVKKRGFNKIAETSHQIAPRYDNQELPAAPPPSHLQQQRPDEPIKYVHQNIPEPKPLAVQTPMEAYSKSTVSPVQHQQPAPQQNYPAPPCYPNNYMNEGNYPLNIPARPQNKMPDMKSYTNMGYSGPDVSYPRGSLPPQYNPPPEELNYARPPSNSQPVGLQQESRYSNANSLHNLCYKGMEITPNSSNTAPGGQQQQQPQVQQQAQMGGYASNQRQQDLHQGGPPAGVSIPRPTYNHLEMEQSMGLRGNIANLSHIVDRYGNDDRILTTLGQAPGGQYGSGGPPPPSAHNMFNKPITSSSGLGNYNNMSVGMQSYSQNMQAGHHPPTSLYNLNAEKANVPAKAEKKTKKRKNAKNAQAAPAEPPAANSQGFQSYAGLKEPSAISLKTASVVPGSAFNFGPTPTGLGISSGLYGDKDAYPNFLDEFRPAPNYYIAAAAHHRSTPDAAGSTDKQTRSAHQSSAAPPQPPGYPFIGAPQPRPPNYPGLSSPFMSSSQAPPLMDAGSPLYQHYLHSGVLNQGLLGPAAYPPGYHPALSMRQPYDSMTRPPWL